MFLNFSKGIISSGVILSSVVSFAGASAQENLDVQENSLDLSENCIYLNEDMQAAPQFEDVQSANKDEAQLGEDDEENNEYIDSKDSLNGSSNTKFAKLKKMGKNVVEKIKKLSPTDFALGIITAGGVGSSIYLKNKNNNLEKQKVNLEKNVKEKEQEISELNNCKNKSEKEKSNRLEQEKNREIEILKDKLTAESGKCNKLQEALDNSKWGLGTWALIILGAYLGYVVLAALVGSGFYLYSEGAENMLKAGANFAITAATFGIGRYLYGKEIFGDD